MRNGKNGGAYLEGVDCRVVKSPQDMHDFLDKAQNNRLVAATAMSVCSSRAYLICTIMVDAYEDAQAGRVMRRSSSIAMVDMVGSERNSALAKGRPTDVISSYPRVAERKN